MDTKSQKKVAAILRVLQDSQKPVGGTRIARMAKRYGVDMSQRTVRHYLAMTDKLKLTRNYGRRGRKITPLGVEELEHSFVMDKVGLVASRIDELSYRMKFSVNTLKGNIILNISTLDEKNLDKAMRYISFVFKKGLSMGNYIFTDRGKKRFGDFPVPRGKVAIGTICSVTINGIFLRAGIPVTSRLGGLLEIRGGKPLRFTEIIDYSGSTLDPLEIFIKGKMTTVYKAAKNGNGIIGASFREIPAVSIPEANRIRRKLDRIGFGGILLIGDSGQPLLDIPVTEGKAGMIVVAGLNPIAAVQERGIETQNMAMQTLFDFTRLQRLPSA